MLICVPMVPPPMMSTFLMSLMFIFLSSAMISILFLCAGMPALLIVKPPKLRDGGFYLAVSYFLRYLLAKDDLCTSSAPS